MKRILFMLLFALSLAGCEDSFTGPDIRPGGTSSGQVVFSAIDYSEPAGWRFGGIKVKDISTDLLHTVIEKNVYLLCAPQADRLVYIEFDEQGPGMQLKTARTDGGDEQVIQAFSSFTETATDRAALSANGKKIAYVVNFDNGQQAGYKLMLYDVDGRMATEIDSDEMWTGGSGKNSLFVTHVSFSPSGNYFAAVKWNGQGHIQVYRTADYGKDMVFAAAGPHFSWMPEGNRILYTENPGLYINDYGMSGLVLVATGLTTVKTGNIDNGDQQILASDFPVVWDVTVSHNGKRVALGQFRAGDPSTTDIVSFDLATPLQQDTLTANSDPGYRNGLQWSGDDSWLLYTVSSNPYPAMLYGEVRRMGMKGQGNVEQLVERLAYGGYWYTN